MKFGGMNIPEEMTMDEVEDILDFACTQQEPLLFLLFLDQLGLYILRPGKVFR